MEKGTDVYYSFTGSDPYVSGFSYDSPVLYWSDWRYNCEGASILKAAKKRFYNWVQCQREFRSWI